MSAYTIPPGIRESVDCLCRDGADTPISLNKCNDSELGNTGFISLFRHITWPMTVSIHIKECKIHCYNMTCIKLLKPGFLHLLLQFKRSSTKLVHLYSFISTQKGLLFLCTVPLPTESRTFPGRVVLKHYYIVERHIMPVWFHVIMAA